MTSYYGGKAKIGKDISEIILDLIKQYQLNPIGYWEPFCGMLGVYRHMIVSSNFREYLATDQHESLIKMWKAAQNNFSFPNHVSEVTHYYYKNCRKSSALRAYVGFGASWGGAYFNKYIKGRISPYTKRKVEEIGKLVKHVRFENKGYDEVKGIKNYVIYCDPPYEDCSGTSDFTDDNKSRIHFNCAAFWQWAELMSKDNLVIVSNYKAPLKWKPIYKRELRFYTDHGGYHRNEFLFILKE